MTGVVEVRDDARDCRQEERLHRENADARNQPALADRGDLQHEDQCRHQRDDSVAELGILEEGHAKPQNQNRNVEMSASAPKMKETMSSSGTRKRRSFALVVSTRTMRHASRSILIRKKTRPRPSPRSVQSELKPNGKNVLTTRVIRTSCLMEAPYSIKARYGPEYSRIMAS